MPCKKQPLSTGDDDTTANKRHKGTSRLEVNGEASIPAVAIAPNTPVPAARTMASLTSSEASPPAVHALQAQPVAPFAQGPPLAVEAVQAQPVALNCPVRIVSAEDIAVMVNNRYVRVTVPYRIHVKIIAKSTVIAITKHTPKPGQFHRQKMLVAGVQEDGTVVILEQWVDLPEYDEGARLAGLDYGTLSIDQKNTLSDNLTFLCTPKVPGVDVLLSVVIGGPEPVQPARGQWNKPPPVATVHVVNDFDDDAWSGGICKIKVPMLLRRTAQAMQLTEANVTQYKQRFDGKDPTTWIPVVQVPADVPIDDGLLTEEDFWA
jgi:hypothetical protein